MKIKRSSKCTLKFATESKKQRLYEIMNEYSRVVNIFIDMFWENDFVAGQLTKDLYAIPASGLSARMRQCAAREALGMVNGAKEAKSTKPRHTGKKCIWSSQVVGLESGRNHFDLWLKIHSTGTGDSFYIPLKQHFHFNQYADWNWATSIIVHREYIQISFEKEVGQKSTSPYALGIDVGINSLLTASNKSWFGDQIKAQINKIKRKKQHSKAYKRAKKELSYYLHRIVKIFFNQLPKEVGLIVVERLKSLKKGKGKRSKGFRKTLSHWNYRELLKVIQMRAEENRVRFRTVNPAKTSQTCPVPTCSHTQRENRVGKVFQCLRCGYSDDADYVGSLNILTRFLTGQYGAGFKAFHEFLSGK